MSNKILICLDLIKYGNRGLGRVAMDYSYHLQNENSFIYNYLLPPDIEIDYLKNKPTKQLTTFQRMSSSFMKGYDLCHILHQLPKFSYKKAKKLVLTIHDLNFLYSKSKTKQKWYKKKVQEAVYKADAICFVSKFTRDDCFRHLDIPKNKITAVIYNGVSELVEPSDKPVWCPEGTFLFTLGQFLDKKNFHVLIPLIKQLPDLKLIMAGENDTKYGEEIKNTIKELGLENRIILPGIISESEKSYLYHHCKAFVFPSIAEGFGLPVIEAMKCGKPVFCSDKTSLKEIGSRHAYFWNDFEPENMISCFNNGMNDFYANENKRIKQIEYAKTFSWTKNIQEYVKIYNQLLNL